MEKEKSIHVLKILAHYLNQHEKEKKEEKKMRSNKKASAIQSYIQTAHIARNKKWEKKGNLVHE